MKKETTVIFDFDGVIADSFHAVYMASAEVCASGVSEGEYRQAYSRNIYEWANDPIVHRKECRHELLDELLPSYIERMVHIFVGMDKSLESLASKYKLYIVTSNSSLIVKSFLAKYAVREYFMDILGREFSKSKVIKLKQLEYMYRVRPETAVFVTDTVGDILEAREAGFDSIAVSWGFSLETSLVAIAPADIVRTPADLPQAVDRYFVKKADYRLAKD